VPGWAATGRFLARVLRWAGGLVGAGFAIAAGWAVHATMHNPRVPLAEPRIVTRPLRGGEITVLLAGDFAPTDAALPALAQHGYLYPYRATADLVRAADVSFANLEAPVTDSRVPFPLWKKYVYRVAPAATEAWQWLGLDLVSLANNHVSDYRERGILDTLRHLDEAGLHQVGAGATESDARRPVIFDVGGTRIGFLGYLEHKVHYNLYLRTFAVGDRVGCAQLNRADVREDVMRLRPLVDILIVSVHWGQNYRGVTAVQEDYARFLVELGVDVVAGHHAHDVQAVERRGASVVFYSLGNYAWGAPGHGHLRVGLLARLRIAPRQGATPGRLTGVELIPIVTQNRIVKFQPRPINLAEVPWLAPLWAQSAARHTRLIRDGTRLRLASVTDPGA
jgi:poly-gamma-glutamate synthesis protein (capsule biosynthesis protein)